MARCPGGVWPLFYLSRVKSLMSISSFGRSPFFWPFLETTILSLTISPTFCLWLHFNFLHDLSPDLSLNISTSLSDKKQSLTMSLFLYFPLPADWRPVRFEVGTRVQGLDFCYSRGAFSGGTLFSWGSKRRHDPLQVRCWKRGLWARD